MTLLTAISLFIGTQAPLVIPAKAGIQA